MRDQTGQFRIKRSPASPVAQPQLAVSSCQNADEAGVTGDLEMTFWDDLVPPLPVFSPPTPAPRSLPGDNVPRATRTYGMSLWFYWFLIWPPDSAAPGHPHQWPIMARPAAATRIWLLRDALADLMRVLTRWGPSAGSMLGQRRRRWPNIKTALCPTIYRIH